MWETNQKKVPNRKESEPLDHQEATLSELELRPDPELVKTGVSLVGIEIEPRPLALFPISLVL